MMNEMAEVLLAEVCVILREDDELVPTEVERLVRRYRLFARRAEIQESLRVIEELPRRLL